MAEATGDQAPRAYFDTPERAERLQLVAHVVRNTDATPYVRGPEGVGKSRFAERLAAIFNQEATLVSLSGAAIVDVRQAVCDALAIPVDNWPVAAIDAAQEDGLLVMVDDVDRLSITALEALQELREVGAKLLFFGESDPVALSIGWELQLIDLPPLSEAQLKDFLQFLGRDEAQSLKGSALSKLLRNSKGLPGRVLEELAEGVLPKMPAAAKQRTKPLKIIGVGALVVLVAVVIWQQDRINALFEPPVPDQPAAVSEPAKEQAPEPPVSTEAITEQPVAAEPPEAVVPAAPAPAPPVEPSAADQDVSPAAEAVTAETPAPVMPEEPVVAPAETVEEVAASPAVVETPRSVTESPSSVEETAPAEPKPEPEPEQLAPEPEPGTLAWLRSRDPKAMTLQLVGARDRAAIDQFIAKHKLSGTYAVYERDLGGKPWYSLVYGEYSDVATAKRARAKLPRPLHSAWPRSFESVIEQLPPEE